MLFSKSPKKGPTLQGQHPLAATLIKTNPKPEKVIWNIYKAIYEIPDPPKIEIGDLLLPVLSTDAEDFLKDYYVSDNALEDKTIKQIKDEYKFDYIKDAFDGEQIPPKLEFFSRWWNENFVNACNFLSLNKDNNELLSLFWSDMGQKLMIINDLSIHAERGDVFNNDFSTKENFYNFLLQIQKFRNLEIQNI